jgi:hypothetical protein
MSTLVLASHTPLIARLGDIVSILVDVVAEVGLESVEFDVA